MRLTLREEGRERNRVYFARNGTLRGRRDALAGWTKEKACSGLEMDARHVSRPEGNKRRKPTKHQTTKKMDYIPTRDADFESWLLNFSTLLTAAPTTYGLTAPDAVAVAAEYTAWNAAYLLATDPSTRTPVSVAAKDSARASAEAVVRPFAVLISLNAAVLPGDKVAIGVTLRNTTPTPIPAPVIAPAIELIKATPLVQQLQIRPVGSTSKAKPAGSVSIEVARSVGTVAATDPAQLSIVGQYGKTPLIQTFTAPDQGKIVTFAARYRTQSGPAGVSQAGPWSALSSFVVI